MSIINKSHYLLFLLLLHLQAYTLTHKQQLNLTSTNRKKCLKRMSERNSHADGGM